MAKILQFKRPIELKEERQVVILSDKKFRELLNDIENRKITMAQFVERLKVLYRERF